MLSRLVLDVLDQVHRGAPRSHLRPLLLTALVVVPLAALVSRRLGGSRLLGSLSGSALAVALSLTLFRGGWGHESLARLGQCALTDPVLLSGDGLANLVLFGPAAFLAALAVGRPLLVALAVLGVSLAVEATQAVEAVGVCDSSDALLNTTGGLLAALVAAALRAGWVRLRPVPGSGPCPGSC